MNDNPQGETREDGQWDVLGESNLYNTLQDVSPVDHLAMLYESHEERLDVALTFLQLGLEANQRCLYVGKGGVRAEVVRGFEALGVDVEAALDSGQLQILTASEVYFRDGRDPEDVVSAVVEVMTEAASDGYDGLRITGEMPADHDPSANFEDVVRYERAFDARAMDFEFCALCQYDVRGLSDEEILALVQAHRKFIYHRRLCENPFYADPDGRTNSDAKTLPADQVLQTAHKLTGARDAIERREQRVGVLNRVLRHNLRNEVTVVQSHAELLRQNTAETDVLDSTDAILNATSRLLDIAENAKRVEESVSGAGADRVPVDLLRTLDRAVARTRDHHPDVQVTNAVEEPTWVESSEELEFALRKLLGTLAEMAEEGAELVAEIDCCRSTNAQLCLVVSCTGGDIPRADIEALARGRETQLSHGSGLGLWLVNWIVELSGGDLCFERSEDEDRVVINLIAA